MQEAQALGLVNEEKDAKLLSLMGDTDLVIEHRYIKTGSKTVPKLEDLKRTSKNIRDSIKAWCAGPALSRSKSSAPCPECVLAITSRAIPARVAAIHPP